MYVSKCLFAYFHNSLHSFTKSRGFPERFLLSAISFAYRCWELKNFRSIFTFFSKKAHTVPDSTHRKIVLFVGHESRSHCLLVPTGVMNVEQSCIVTTTQPL